MSAANSREIGTRKIRRFSRGYFKTKAWEHYLKHFVHPPQSLDLIPGYLHPLEARFLFWLAGRIPERGLALEIGSFKGKSSANLAAGLKAGARLVCVDTWENKAMPYDPPVDVLPEFLRNVASYGDLIETHRGTSIEVARVWSRPLDLLFIDGDHSYEGCSTDLKAWLPFLKPGGWVAFHDSSEAGVARAIHELFPKWNQSSARCAWSVFAAIKRGKRE
jgi:predicted O-methyltransferase YrrM